MGFGGRWKVNDNQRSRWVGRIGAAGLAWGCGGGQMGPVVPEPISETDAASSWAEGGGVAAVERWSGEAVRASRYRVEVVVDGIQRGLMETSQQTAFTFRRAEDGALRIAPVDAPKVRARVLRPTYQVRLLEGVYGVEPAVEVAPGRMRPQVPITPPMRQVGEEIEAYLRRSVGSLLGPDQEGLSLLVDRVRPMVAAEGLALDVALRWQDLLVPFADPDGAPTGEPVAWLSRTTTTYAPVELVGQRVGRGPEPCPAPHQEERCDVVVVDVQWPEAEMWKDHVATIREVVGEESAQALLELIARLSPRPTPPVRMRQLTTWRSRSTGRPVRSEAIEVIDAGGDPPAPSFQLTWTTTHELTWRDR